MSASEWGTHITGNRNPVEGEHISRTVYTDEHISAGRGHGYVYWETHITVKHISALHRGVTGDSDT